MEPHHLLLNRNKGRYFRAPAQRVPNLPAPVASPPPWPVAGLFPSPIQQPIEFATMTRTLNVAMIGGGFMGKAHALAYAAMPMFF